MLQSPVLETNSCSPGLKGEWMGLPEVQEVKGATRRLPVFSFPSKLLPAHGVKGFSISISILRGETWALSCSVSKN